jgi:hypothetical protein
MSISKLNAEQFSAMGNSFKGVVLEYAGKDGKNTGIIFFGKDYEATEKTQDEILRVTKNVMLAHWEVKGVETVLREKNDGIRSKLRASTPLKIHVRTDKCELVKSYNLEDCVWARIGLVPTKKDLERSHREQKRCVHEAAKAMLEALNFRLELPKAEKMPDENAGQLPAVKSDKKTDKTAIEIKKAA